MDLIKVGYQSTPTHLKTKLLNGVHIHENNFYKFVNVSNAIQNCNPPTFIYMPFLGQIQNDKKSTHKLTN